jgi:hypothetical protein
LTPCLPYLFIYLFIYFFFFQKSTSDQLKKEFLDKISSLQRENDQLRSSLRELELSPNTIQSAAFKVSEESAEFIDDKCEIKSQTEFQNQSVNQIVNQIDIRSRDLIPNAVNIISTDINIQIKDSNESYYKPMKEFTDIAMQVEMMIPVVHHVGTQTVDSKPLKMDVECQYEDPDPNYSQILEKAIESIKNPKITFESSTQVDHVVKKSSYVQATINPFPCDIGIQYIGIL